MSEKKHLTAIILCIVGLFSIDGLHRFYVGKNISGVIFLITFGFFKIGTIIDLIILSFGNFKDAEGKKLS